MTALARQLGTVVLKWSAEHPTVTVPAVTCAHCNCVVVLFPDSVRIQLGLPLRTRERGYCQKCDAYVCDQSVCRNNCTPTQALIDYALKHPEAPVFQRPGGQLPFDPDILKELKVY